MIPKLIRQDSERFVLSLKKKGRIFFFPGSVYAYPLRSCMVAKKLVKCKELQQKKGDEGWQEYFYVINFSCLVFLLHFFVGSRTLGSFPKNGQD